MMVVVVVMVMMVAMMVLVMMMKKMDKMILNFWSEVKWTDWYWYSPAGGIPTKSAARMMMTVMLMILMSWWRWWLWLSWWWWWWRWWWWLSCRNGDDDYEGDYNDYHDIMSIYISIFPKLFPLKCNFEMAKIWYFISSGFKMVATLEIRSVWRAEAALWHSLKVSKFKTQLKQPKNLPYNVTQINLSIPSPKCNINNPESLQYYQKSNSVQRMQRSWQTNKALKVPRKMLPVIHHFLLRQICFFTDLNINR